MTGFTNVDLSELFLFDFSSEIEKTFVSRKRHLRLQKQIDTNISLKNVVTGLKDP